MLGESHWLTGEPKEGTKKSKTGDYRSYNRWSKRIEEKFESCHQHLRTFPFVFIYLIDDEKPVCYWKAKPIDFTEPDAK